MKLKHRTVMKPIISDETKNNIFQFVSIMSLPIFGDFAEDFYMLTLGPIFVDLSLNKVSL